MTSQLTEQEAAFRRACRAWLEAHVPATPLASHNTREGFAAHVAWEKVLFEARWAVVSWPEEFGGRGASLMEWLIFEKQVNLVGTDASGIEVKGVPDQPNHALLMKHQIPILEFVANLNALQAERFTLLVLPMRIVGLDSCPVRLIAIEEE